jgi:hypothetical protein
MGQQSAGVQLGLDLTLERGYLRGDGARCPRRSQPRQRVQALSGLTPVQTGACARAGFWICTICGWRDAQPRSASRTLCLRPPMTPRFLVRCAGLPACCLCKESPVIRHGLKNRPIALVSGMPKDQGMDCLGEGEGASTDYGETRHVPGGPGR